MDADSKKSVAAWSSVIWSGALAATKLVVGIITGSLGILSEALHSALDLVAAGGTVYAVKVSARPADEEHPYGHGRDPAADGHSRLGYTGSRGASAEQ